ncbi:class I SAM-dependent methyltransferase [Methanobacterium movens]
MINMSIKKNKEDWEDLAKMDPLWAILSARDKKYGNWDINDFFSLGQKEIEKIMEESSDLKYPFQRRKVLDFGCGVGRLSRALSNYFDSVYCVDISENMIDQGRKLNKDYKNLKFILNNKANLEVFEDGCFDMIYTNLVLQHITEKDIIKFYISEFIRVLSNNGLLIFQLPSSMSTIGKIDPRRRLYRFLKLLNFSENFLYNKLKLSPMTMNFIPENEIVELIKNNNANIIKIKRSKTRFNYHNNIYYVTK